MYKVLKTAVHYIKHQRDLYALSALYGVYTCSTGGSFEVGSVYRTGTGPQRNCLKEPGKARDAISMQREWENNFPAVLSTFSWHPTPKTFWLNPKDHHPDAYKVTGIC